METGDDTPGSSGPRERRELHSKVRRASFWLLAGTSASHAVRLASNIALTRVLPAETFGLMALVQVFLQGLQLFSDIGIGPAIIQNKQGNDPQFLNTAFTLQAMRGALLFGVACVGAAPFAAFYGQVELAYLLPVAGINAALLGFRSSKTFIQNRELALGRMTLIELFSQVAAAVVMVVWASATHSVWALVGGGIVRNLIYVPAGHWLLPGTKNRLHWDRAIAKRLLVFGRWVFVSTALTFIAAQADRLIFGRLLTLRELGVYSIAAILAATPSTVFVSLSRTLVFPVYSRAHRSGEDMAVVYPSARWPLLVLGGFALSALAASAPDIVDVLYHGDFRQAGWLVQLLAMGIWFGVVLTGTNTEVLLALGLPRWSAACSLVKAVALVALLPLGFAAYGFAGAVVGLVVSDVCRYACSVYAAQRHGLRGVRQDLGVTAIAGLSVAAASVALWIVADRTIPALVEGLLAVIVVAVVWSPWLLPFVRPYFGRSAKVSARDGAASV